MMNREAGLLDLGELIEEVDPRRGRKGHLGRKLVDPLNDVLQRETLFGFQSRNTCAQKKRKKKERRPRSQRCAASFFRRPPKGVMSGLTLVSHFERVVHHRLHDLFDVGRFGVARALVHFRLGRQLVRRVTCLGFGVHVQDVSTQNS